MLLTLREWRNTATPLSFRIPAYWAAAASSLFPALTSPRRLQSPSLGWKLLQYLLEKRPSAIKAADPKRGSLGASSPTIRCVFTLLWVTLALKAKKWPCQAACGVLWIHIVTAICIQSWAKDGALWTNDWVSSRHPRVWKGRSRKWIPAACIHRTEWRPSITHREFVHLVRSRLLNTSAALHRSLCKLPRTCEEPI